MKKIYCDLCGRPAVADLRAESSVQCPVSDVDNATALIVAAVRFNFRDHPSGYVGVPDLCAEHAHALLVALSEHIFIIDAGFVGHG